MASDGPKGAPDADAVSRSLDFDRPDLRYLKPTRLRKMRQVVWRTLEDPTSSWVASVISWSMMLIITTSIVNFIFGSCPENFCHWRNAYVLGEATRECSGTRLETFESMKNIEIVCIAFFTLEYVARLLCCGVEMPVWKFIIHPLNLVDLIAILPWYASTIVALVAQGGDDMTKIFGIVRIVRLTRVLRVLKASKSMKMMMVLGRTMVRSGTALLILSVAVVGMMLLFGAIIVVFERGEYNPYTKQYLNVGGQPTAFLSIPTAMYFTMTTMTTVGYGDLYPETAMGKVTGVIAILIGIVVLSLPITVIGNTFSEEFEEQNRIAKRERRLRKLDRLTNPGSTRSLTANLSGHFNGETWAAASISTSTNDQSLATNRDLVPGFMQCEWLLEDFRAQVAQHVREHIDRSEADFLRLSRKVVIHSRVCVPDLQQAASDAFEGDCSSCGLPCGAAPGAKDCSRMALQDSYPSAEAPASMLMSPAASQLSAPAGSPTSASELTRSPSAPMAASPHRAPVPATSADAQNGNVPYVLEAIEALPAGGGPDEADSAVAVTETAESSD